MFSSNINGNTNQLLGIKSFIGSHINSLNNSFVMSSKLRSTYDEPKSLKYLRRLPNSINERMSEYFSLVDPEYKVVFEGCTTSALLNYNPSSMNAILDILNYSERVEYYLSIVRSEILYNPIVFSLGVLVKMLDFRNLNLYLVLKLKNNPQPSIPRVKNKNGLISISKDIDNYSEDFSLFRSLSDMINSASSIPLKNLESIVLDQVMEKFIMGKKLDLIQLLNHDEKISQIEENINIDGIKNKKPWSRPNANIEVVKEVAIKDQIFLSNEFQEFDSSLNALLTCSNKDIVDVVTPQIENLKKAKDKNTVYLETTISEIKKQLSTFKKILSTKVDDKAREDKHNVINFFKKAASLENFILEHQDEEDPVKVDTKAKTEEKESKPNKIKESKKAEVDQKVKPIDKINQKVKSIDQNKRKAPLIETRVNPKGSL